MVTCPAKIRIGPRNEGICQTPSLARQSPSKKCQDQQLITCPPISLFAEEEKERFLLFFHGENEKPSEGN
jgi:hypothetical protein